MRRRALIIVSVTVLGLFTLISFPLHPVPASAHIAKSFGNYIVEVGWNDEPPLTGQMNAVQVTVVKGSHVDSGQPVINALAKMNMVIKFGTVTKKIDFLPSPTVNGQYISSIIPTKAGTYGLVMNGTIEDQPVNAEIPLDQVVSSDTISFPVGQSSGDGGGNAAISSQLGTVVNQLIGDITDAKKSVSTAAQNYQTAAKSLQGAKDSIDKLYMISMVGIGVGGSGVVIGVIALTRKK